jgi:hypothetical protein
MFGSESVKKFLLLPLHFLLCNFKSQKFFVCRQCSECDKESSGSDFEVVDTEAPRRLRHNKEAEKPVGPVMPKVSSFVS